jgi:hypothetical protein
MKRKDRHEGTKITKEERFQFAGRFSSCPWCLRGGLLLWIVNP